MRVVDSSAVAGVSAGGGAGVGAWRARTCSARSGFVNSGVVVSVGSSVVDVSSPDVAVSESLSSMSRLTPNRIPNTTTAATAIRIAVPRVLSRFAAVA